MVLGGGKYYFSAVGTVVHPVSFSLIAEFPLGYVQ